MTQTQITELDTDLEEADEEGVEMQHFSVGDEIEVSLGDTAGHEVTVSAEHFIAAAIDVETEEMEQALGAPERNNAGHVLVSNEDGELGAVVTEVVGAESYDEDEGVVTIEDAIDTFTDENL